MKRDRMADSEGEAGRMLGIGEVWEPEKGRSSLSSFPRKTEQSSGVERERKGLAREQEGWVERKRLRRERERERDDG